MELFGITSDPQSADSDDTVTLKDADGNTITKAAENDVVTVVVSLGSTGASANATVAVTKDSDSSAVTSSGDLEHGWTFTMPGEDVTVTTNFS